MPYFTAQESSDGSKKPLITKIHVRATIATILVIGLVGGFFTGRIDAEAYKNITMIALVWYFSKDRGANENS